MTVDVFIPCFVDQIYPQTAFNMIKVLKKCGVEVHYNEKQTCCGQMAFNSGFWDEAKSIGTKFIRDFPHNRPVVGPSASCVGYVKNYYHKLFYNSSLHNEYKQLIKNIYEFSDFMVNVLKKEDLGAKFEAKVTWHDSCAALREYGIKEEPRKLLAKVQGLELIEMEETDVCCGFGGTFAVKHEPISTAMAEQKVEHAMKTGAEYIVSTDSSCLMHQYAYITKHKLPLKVIHLADVLAAGW
ncbi:MAG: (Fe-S)-binding protein [Bacteroidales bacterium]|nr:(Fe-S)-binding protein [Bacteroidales bacterium]MCF8350819.1 (Fe-S)-binding protein [Bacteroidales bacterium]MCF8375392.1 (Fe-S)-binding protein [Bacteroidales bacterium]MCF8401269.1 (Fe-S)-binding protein [Bacteroidales bacterium]